MTSMKIYHRNNRMILCLLDMGQMFISGKIMAKVYTVVTQIHKNADNILR